MANTPEFFTPEFRALFELNEGSLLRLDIISWRNWPQNGHFGAVDEKFNYMRHLFSNHNEL
jgi:hypothetical protein